MSKRNNNKDESKNNGAVTRAMASATPLPITIQMNI